MRKTTTKAKRPAKPRPKPARPADPPLPPKPDVESLSVQVQAFASAVLGRYVLPYLQALLDAAQARTKYPLKLHTGMGCFYVGCEAEALRFNDFKAVEDSYFEKRPEQFWSDEIRRLREAFPTLTELFAVGIDADENVAPLGDMEPTVPPATDTGEQDPVDYVVRGPVMTCAGWRCKARGTEWEFLCVRGKWVCPACAEKMS